MRGKNMNNNIEIKTASINSVDGTKISYKIMGNGPGLIIVHGAFRAAEHYVRLGKCLSENFTVYIIDRRGRNESGPRGDKYSVQKECEDVITIMEEHNVSYLFGHSFGALVSLKVALQHPVEKLALFEPPMLEIMPMDWTDKFESQLNDKDYVAASVTFIKGMQMGGIIGFIPNPILKIMFKKMAEAKGEEWEKNCKLLSTVPEEIKAGLLTDANFDMFKDITTRTLLMSGTKSPKYLLKAIEKLGSILPNSQSVSFKGLNHNAPDEGAPEEIAKDIINFLSN